MSEKENSAPAATDAEMLAQNLDKLLSSHISVSRMIVDEVKEKDTKVSPEDLNRINRSIKNLHIISQVKLNYKPFLKLE